MNKTILIASAAAFVFAAPAVAGPGKGNNHAGHGQHGSSMGYGTGHCPPGLAKKNSRCMPPGQYKKLYSVGQRLPYGYNGYTPYNQIPYDVRQSYGLDPYGQYIYDQNYVYRVDPKTQVISAVLNAILR